VVTPVVLVVQKVAASVLIHLGVLVPHDETIVSTCGMGLDKGCSVHVDCIKHRQRGHSMDKEPA
jgi:hypothetical protein